MLFAGVLSGHAAAAAVAAGGAITVGFGAVQTFSHTRSAPMVLAAAGMAVSACIGSLAGHSVAALAVVSGVWAMAAALATTMGTGAWWIVLQWAVALIVAGAFPAELTGAVQRGLLVLAGAAVQTALILLLWRLRGPYAHLEPPMHLHEALALFRQNLAERRDPALFALRAALTVMLATVIAHASTLANGYWAPMTAIVVLKPRWRETAERGLVRILGTASGACIAGGAAVLIGASPGVLAACALVAGVVTVALQRVNYGLFTAALTAYIVYLLALLHTPAALVAVHRVVATLIGGGLALAVDGLLSPLMAIRFRRAAA